MSTFFGAFSFSDTPSIKSAVQQMASAIMPTPKMSASTDNMAVFGCLSWFAFEECAPTTSKCGTLFITGYFRLDYVDELCIKLGISVPVSNEVIIFEAYKKWGQRCVEHIEGDWAFALYDQQRRSLLLARDPISGYSGLFFMTYKNQVYFSSDLNLFKHIPGFSAQIDFQEFAFFSLIQFAGESNKTLFKDVFRLEPGNYIEFKTPHAEIKTYWELKKPEIKFTKHVGDYPEALKEILDKAVKTRISKNTNNGIFLSAGYDSGIVAHMAANELYQQSRKLYSFTSVPAYKDKIKGPTLKLADEQPMTEELSAQLPGLTSFFLDNRDAMYSDLLLKTASDWNRPKVYSNLLYLEAIFKQASKHNIGSMLTGQIGNATISANGKNLISGMILHGKYFSAATELKQITGQSDESFYEVIKEHLLRDLKTSTTNLLNRIKPLQKQWPISSNILHKEALRHIDWERVRSLIQNMPYYTSYQSSLSNRYHLLQLLPRLASNAWHALATSHRIQVTDPTADKRLVEFSLTVPENLWCMNGERRFLYKAAFGNQMPTSILENKLKMRQSADLAFRILADEQLADLINSLISEYKDSEVLDSSKLVANWNNFKKETNLEKKNILGSILLPNISVFLLARHHFNNV